MSKGTEHFSVCSLFPERAWLFLYSTVVALVTPPSLSVSLNLPFRPFYSFLLYSFFSPCHHFALCSWLSCR